MTCKQDSYSTMTRTQFHPGEIWPDDRGVHINAHGGGIVLHEGVYYWYGQHMIEGEAGNAAHVGVRVYSSRDLFQWTDRGIALAVDDRPGSEISQGCILERPKVVRSRATGQFVMWFHLEPKGMGYLGARSGIAIADSPVGPFRFIKSIRPNADHWASNTPMEQRRTLDDAERSRLSKSHFPGSSLDGVDPMLIHRRDHAGGQMARDMTLFEDDHGSVYHIYASEENATLHISQLTPDLLGCTGKYVRLFPGYFNEAPTIFKRDGRYWMITSGCTGWAPNAGRLAVADSIWGPWTALGNPCVGPGAELTFDSQGTFILPAPDRPGAFIFMADRWRPDNAIDGRHIWLPIQFDARGTPSITWIPAWDFRVQR